MSMHSREFMMTRKLYIIYSCKEKQSHTERKSQLAYESLFCINQKESVGVEDKKAGEAMEGGSSNNTALGPKLSELKVLQKEHEEKSSKIQELKRQIESTKHRLEKKKDVTGDKMGGFNALSKKYNILREEYNAILAEKQGDQSNFTT
uniref:Uncharacterized protein LOC113787093 isoform X2 n=1 Tax=Cicer arietinum TaxID=3827 RepID=A0A3Q7Y1M9_CICAR|nr:uncharacterized protein LOC113787093 isoform X2 [Cicer arietinum]